MDDFEVFSDFVKSQKPKETPKYTDVRELYSGNGDYNEMFNFVDKNNDQKLTRKEAKALPEVDTAQEFKLADENKDKLISFDEYLKALPEKDWNKIDKAPNEKDKYNAFSNTLNNYYNEYVNTLDPNDPDYDAKVGIAQDDAEEQLRKSGYWNYNPETGKDYIVNPDFDPEEGSIAKDTRVKERVQSVLNNAINEHNVSEMAEVLNKVIPNLPLYTDTEKAEEGRQMKEKFEGAMSAIRNLGYNEAMANDVFSGIHKVGDTGEIWQEVVSDDVYKKLSNWSFDELSELSKKVPNIRWKKLANAVAKSETSDKGKQNKRSKEWLQDWKDYVSGVDVAAKHLNKLSNNHIEKEEVEQVLYRDYVQDAKTNNKKGEKQKTVEKKEVPTSTQPTQSTQLDVEKVPIQITEKTNIRERIIEEAARHIMKHGKSLPKELKKSVQEISSKFEPFKFEHKKAEDNENVGNGKPLVYSDSDGLGMELGHAGSEDNVPNGNITQTSFGYSGSSGSNGSNGSNGERKGVGSSGNSGGSSKARSDLPEPRFSFGGKFEGIGDFSKKPHPINIKMPKGTKTKKFEFPDLSPDVELHNETENIPDVAKASRPIIKNGLYQDKSDKVDNDIYSNVIKDIIDEYKDWENVDEMYLKDIPQLNITLYYDGVSQPKVKAKGMGGKQNISTLLRKEGGREILENLYSYLEGEK